MNKVGNAIVIGMAIVMAGTIPRNIIFLANTIYLKSIPWALPVLAVYLWYFWRYLNGWGKPHSSSSFRKENLRARNLPAHVWIWALISGIIGIAAIVVYLRVLNTMVVLPQQDLSNFKDIPALTLYSLLIAAAPIAGIVEEAAFRGYMQYPIEQRYGLLTAILITGTMFAVAHLDFTLVLWPYYVSVAAVYGTIASLTKSILPGIVLHTIGNIYSNLDLLLHGRAEWQAPGAANELIWNTGTDFRFWLVVTTMLLLIICFILASMKLSIVVRKNQWS